MRKPAQKASLVNEGGKLSITAVFIKVGEGYIGFTEELPGANTQGATLEETREAVLLFGGMG
jgi:hypothetical protein